MIRKIRLVTVVALLAAGIAAGDVAAHAKLLRASPAPGGSVAEPPTVVRVWFQLSGTEELDPKRSALSVWDARGKHVDDGKGGVDLDDLDRRSMVVRLKPVGPGRLHGQMEGGLDARR